MSATPKITITESTDPLAVPRRVALVRPDIRPAVRKKDEKYVMTYPHLIVREVILFQVVVIVLSVVALLMDAPLEGIANPVETPNPAKAPWYFLGLQELLHYFPPVVAGVLMPALAVIALVVVPYAHINLDARALWERDTPGKAPRLAAALAALVVLFGYFRCWPIVVPTIVVGAAMYLARGGEKAGGFRAFLADVTLPEWIMTWFVSIATVLTVIGTFFRGPGWSWVWPWVAGASF